MRISLLLQREPFGSVLEKTLARFWRARHERDFRVCWQVTRPGSGSPKSNGTQTWLVNAYLNAIFTPDVDPVALEPIRQEFTHSLVWWKRPFQRAYVGLAASRAGAAWMAQASIHVIPAVPNANQKIIVAGNHKIRLLDRKNGLTHSVLKEGFQPTFMKQELRARQQATAAGVPVPILLEVADDCTGFSEQYVSGTPANRLPTQEERQRAITEAVHALSPLVHMTQKVESREQYLNQLCATIRQLLGDNHLLDAPTKKAFLRQVATLATLARQSKAAQGDRLVTALTHGDFQPGNILVSEESVWLVDWEYAQRRQAGYDALVLSLKSRFPWGLSDRLSAFVEKGLPAGSPIGAVAWPGLAGNDHTSHLQQASFFLLEEILLHLEENAELLFTRLGPGMPVLQSEIDLWLAMGPE